MSGLGLKIHVYRLVIAATGPYIIDHLPMVSQEGAGIVASLGRREVRGSWIE